MAKKPKISLKTSTLATIILLVLFSFCYVLYFIESQKLEIVFGIIGFMYFYSVYTLASRLFLKGAIKMKPATVFWIAFFSSAIPFVHLVMPIYLLRKGKGIKENI